MKIRFLTAACCAIMAGLFVAPVDAAQEENREFQSGAVWLIFDGPVKTALHLSTPNPSQVQDLGEVIVIVDDASQLNSLDMAALRDSIGMAAERAQQLCESFAVTSTPCPTYSVQRPVVGVTNDVEAGADGHIPEGQQLFTGTVSRTGVGTSALLSRKAGEADESRGYLPEGWVDDESAGEANESSPSAPDIKIVHELTFDNPPELAQRWQAQIQTERQQTRTERKEEIEQAHEEARAEERAELDAKSATISATYDPMLATHMAAAEPESVGLLDKLGSLVGLGSQPEIVGAWSGSPSECDQKLLLFFEDADAKPTVAIWEQPPSLDAMIPALKGEWEIRDEVVIMSINERTSYGGDDVSTNPMDETFQFEVISAGGEELRLGVPGGGSLSKEALLLDGTNEKMFVRCDTSANPS